MASLVAPVAADLVRDLLTAGAPHGSSAGVHGGRAPEEVARDFEAILVSQMISAMRRTVPDGGMLEASASRRLLDGAFDYELAKAVLRGADLGIARQLAAAITRQSGDAERVPATLRGDGSSPVAATLVDGRADPPSARPPVFVPPVAGRITSGFGVRRDPLTGHRQLHRGIDLAVPRGTPIRSVADGVVVFSGPRGAAGNVVEVEHTGGLHTSYAHADRTLVAVGQKVGAGEVLGRSGSTGRSTGPHLHFAATREGQPIDPRELFQHARGELQSL